MSGFLWPCWLFGPKVPYSQSYGFSSSHVQMWELGNKKGWVTKNWCLWTVVLEKTPESPLDTKETKLVNLKGEQPWIFTGRTDGEVEPSVFWSSVANRQLIGKVPDAGKAWGQKRAWENEMAGWHHWCNEHELGQIPEGGEGQGGLACRSPWGHKESDTTWRLNGNKERGQLNTTWYPGFEPGTEKGY